MATDLAQFRDRLKDARRYLVGTIADVLAAKAVLPHKSSP